MKPWVIKTRCTGETSDLLISDLHVRLYPSSLTVVALSCASTVAQLCTTPQISIQWGEKGVSAAHVLSVLSVRLCSV